MKLPINRTKIQTRYSDTDALGHISSGSYVTYMQIGRTAFFNDVARLSGYDKPSVVVNINLDYFNECRYGDEIEVVSWCSHVGNKSLKVCNEIYANGQLVAKGSATNVGFNPDTRKSEAFPADWQVSDVSENSIQDV